MTFKYADWMTLTKRSFVSRSTALKEVDRLFKLYEDSNYKNQNHLDGLSQAFKVWSNTKTKTATVGLMVTTTFDTGRNKKKDGTTGLGAVELLRDFIQSQNISNVVHQVNVTGLVDRVAIVEVKGAPLSQSEGAKVQEAIRSLQTAIRTARDAVIEAKNPGAKRNLYVKWFGAYTVANAKVVRDRFMTLDDICSNKGIIFNDGRGDAVNRAAYAWAYPGTEINFPNMWLGDGFFNSAIGLGKGRQAAGDTLGTLVHELTHGCFNTGDVPIESLIDTTACDEFGSPIDYGNVAVCNDPKNDCRLADRRPLEAIRNADNYGEFVVETHTGLLYNYVWP